ncbi:zinc finger BED domain-containing protein 5-like [Octopus sinensis]|uniref:Zinc finger BED domain-containing protein 5-like n=1 Tax=Octopus sinensis TaxID=2607531 RepID=A0A6P7TWG6_9MOLL|nr:zinc finger BED domain-containing protein 5-like [Octopus sinensis]
MFGHKYEQKIMKIPLSDNTVSRRICALSENIEKSVSFSIKETRFSLQLDEATDISGMAHLLAYIRFVYSGKITEQFLFCKPLLTTTRAIDMFTILNDYFNINNISFANCIGICTDGAPYMSGRINGLVSLVESKNNKIISSHCFLHREVLVVKTLPMNLKSVLDDIIRMINDIKSRPKKSRIFTTICDEMGSNFTNLLLHTEIRWLSRGKASTRVFEVKDEMYEFFKLEGHSEFVEKIQNPIWSLKLAYLSDILQILNEVNASMQGRSETILSSTDKLNSLKMKISFWRKRVLDGDYSMFPNTNG